MHDAKEGDDLIAIYVPTGKLSVCQSGVTSGGTIVAFETIPFKEVRAIWRFKPVKKGPVKEVRRIYSRVEICPGFKDAVGVRLSWKPQPFEDDPSSISNRVCPACAVIIPRGFCYCAACECELISTGKFVIHVDDDEPKPSDTANVTEEVKQAQREAKEDAERIVAEEERPDTNGMSEERSAGRSHLPSTSGRTSTTKMREFVRTTLRRMRTQFTSCKSKPSALTSPARHHTSLASHRAFKVWKVFANNEADVVKEAGKGGGVYCPYIAINGRDDWVFNEVDEQNIPVPPTYNEVVAAP